MVTSPSASRLRLSDTFDPSFATRLQYDVACLSEYVVMCIERPEEFRGAVQRGERLLRTMDLVRTTLASDIAPSVRDRCEENWARLDAQFHDYPRKRLERQGRLVATRGSAFADILRVSRLATDERRRRTISEHRSIIDVASTIIERCTIDGRRAPSSEDFDRLYDQCRTHADEAATDYQSRYLVGI